MSYNKFQAYKYSWNIRDTILAAISKHCVNAATKLYYKLKRAELGTHIFNEMQLNLVGERLNGLKQYREANTIFRINKEEYPTSWKTFHNLGDSFMMLGITNVALQPYEKALALSPENRTILEKIKKQKKMRRFYLIWSRFC